MSALGLVTLGDIRLQAQQRADRVNSNFVTTTEWNAYISSSAKELYDLLITTYGSDYYVAPPYQFVTTGLVNTYTLPDGLTTTSVDTGLVAAPLYKLIGVDLQAFNTNNDWCTLHRFEFTDRNKYSRAISYNFRGYQNLKYKIVGNNLWFQAPPQAGQIIQLWYIPKSPNLQTTVTGTTTASTSVVQVSDTSALAVGQSVQVLGVSTSTYLISTISQNTSFTLTGYSAATTGATQFQCWSDTTSFEGISGWEEYVILDAAIKALLKEESDANALMSQKAAMLRRIEESAPNRDAAEAPTVSDNDQCYDDFGKDRGDW
jgi:hypothetical protein